MNAALKICGINSPYFANAAAEAGVDYLGLIFVPGSPRAVTVEEAVWIRRSVRRKNVRFVGVFVNEAEEVIRRIAEQLKLDVIQLHGSESAALADSLRKDYEVWKAVSETFEPDYPADAFLADSSRPGSGTRADGELVRRIRQTGKRWILAGGISEENLSEALRSGADILDVNSSLENFPGRKNILKLNQFMNKYHQYQGDRK